MNDFLNEINNRKGKVFVFVEGVFDLAIVNLYLCKKYHLKYNAKPNDSLPWFACRNPGEQVEHYSNEYWNVGIYSVGGKNKFTYFYDSYIKNIFLKNNDSKLNVDRIIIIRDRDKDDDDKIIENSYIGQKNKHIIGEWINNEWEHVEGLIDYNNFQSYLSVVPQTYEGCMETLLINAYRNETPNIVKPTIDFVDKLNINNNLFDNDSDLIKTKLGVIITIKDFNYTFEELKNKFNSININNETICQAFDFFDFLDSPLEQESQN